MNGKCPRLPDECSFAHGEANLMQPGEAAERLTQKLGLERVPSSPHSNKPVHLAAMAKQLHASVPIAHPKGPSVPGTAGQRGGVGGGSPLGLPPPAPPGDDDSGGKKGLLWSPPHFGPDAVPSHHKQGKDGTVGNRKKAAPPVAAGKNSARTAATEEASLPAAHTPTTASPLASGTGGLTEHVLDVLHLLRTLLLSVPSHQLTSSQVIPLASLPVCLPPCSCFCTTFTAVFR